MLWHLDILFAAVKQSPFVQHLSGRSTAAESSSIFEPVELQTTFVAPMAQIKLLWLSSCCDSNIPQEATRGWCADFSSRLRRDKDGLTSQRGIVNGNGIRADAAPLLVSRMQATAEKAPLGHSRESTQLLES